MRSLGAEGEGLAHLLSSNLDVVVRCGDDDVFGGEVTHVHCKLVGVSKCLDVAWPPRTRCGGGCGELSTGQACTQNPGFRLLLLGKGVAPRAWPPPQLLLRPLPQPTFSMVGMGPHQVRGRGGVGAGVGVCMRHHLQAWSRGCILLLNPKQPCRAPGRTWPLAPWLTPEAHLLLGDPPVLTDTSVSAATSVLVATCGHSCAAPVPGSSKPRPHSEVPQSRCPLPVSLPSHQSPENLPGKVRGSEWGRMKLLKSSENMLRALSMGGSWAGRAREAEEDEEDEEDEEEEWKLLSALKVEEVLWLIHGRAAGPWPGGQGRTGEGVGDRLRGSMPSPDCRCFIRPDCRWARGQALVYQLNLGLTVAQRGLEIFSSEIVLLTAQHTQAREAELTAQHSRPGAPAPGPPAWLWGGGQSCSRAPQTLVPRTLCVW